jgi:RNA polymerase-binding transcription factor DksA
MAKKVNKKAKPAKKASKPAAKKVSKPAKKTAAKKPAKPAKKVTKPVAKKAAKPAKKIAKPVAKKAPVKGNDKKSVKDLMVKKGKPIDAIKKGAKPDPKAKKSGKKKGGDDDDDDEADVKDDYEKADEDDVIEGDLEEPALLEPDGESAPVDDDDDDEVPIKKGRGRRKKSEGTSKSGSMESYIRNRPLQIDLSKPLIKKNAEAEPKPFVNTKDNRSRYTDKELAEFKELILDKLKEAQADYDLLKQTLSNEDNHGTDDTSPTFKLLEDGSDVLSKEETAQLAARQEKYIINLKNALVRIENKTYGICRVSGKLIPKERLRSVPHATLGIDAKLNQNR